MELTEKSQAVLDTMKEMDITTAFNSMSFMDIINNIDNVDDLGITPRSHGIITSLVKKGLVQKGSDTAEGRKTYFLTDEGKTYEK